MRALTLESSAVAGLVAQIPGPIWLCGPGVVSRLECFTEVTSELRQELQGIASDQLIELLETDLLCTGDEGLYQANPMPAPKPTPTPSPLLALETPADVAPWAELFWDRAPNSFIRRRMLAEGEHIFTRLEGPVVDGKQLVITRFIPEGNRIASIAVLIAGSDPAQLYSEPPDVTVFTFGLKEGGELIFADQPTGDGCPECRPATNDDVARLREFVALTLAE